ncbi:WD40 repeat-like protein [Guyanagaster necrorhizus]|uniref:WD40 repeat-like protein n=1 Tax=Guyanagaster necrorhizus TaxID=856835 RepID=A0A9P7VYR6_9AGAR|nr:WD40 repeat-like protein [Guyanagaster necrorhizus MCA 3950]KAG7448286.1 WD40 repeat-like protein [Guyanagaster necrorhizus MCA 3950]
MHDEGYTDEDSWQSTAAPLSKDAESLLSGMSMNSVQECEELAYRLLASLPRSRLATIQRRLAPLLQFDVVGSLPTEVSLQIFSHLSAEALLACALVCRRWQTLANDQSLWKNLCLSRGWQWRQPRRTRAFDTSKGSEAWQDSDDEGMGDSDEEADEDEVADSLMSDVETARVESSVMHSEQDSGFASMSFGGNALPFEVSTNGKSESVYPRAGESSSAKSRIPFRHSAPPVLNALGPSLFLKADYKLLHQTHVRLHNRVLSPSYRLSALQTRGAPANSHTNTIYCLQLYTYPSTGVQVLFTGSRDKTVREWNLSTGLVERVIGEVHSSSVLSICVYNGLLASAGSDRRVVVWDLEKNELVKVISDHEDSVLCVRFDDERLVSCSKDRYVRTYSFPDLEPEFRLGAHRAAVNAVSISQTLIVSGSGDRSVRLWDTKTGSLLRTFENHHTRGIASIDSKLPYVLSGSSDKHLRLFDITTLQGWSTSPDVSLEGNAPATNTPLTTSFPLQNGQVGTHVCRSCGSTNVQPAATSSHAETRCMHGDLVRSVALGDNFVMSGSYDLTIKVWDRKTGALVADLSGGHTGRIFCIGFDCTKIVSCGEDQRICIWDFSHGIDTSFIQL